ncbi:MAG: phosphotransferase [Pelagibacteraceae bacterium]|nr:phosphotransferase [Pelagibacteraceae bacterium]MBT4646177.1 phosphotransferase [Pelagibacteraceae bacterium]MBT5214578.1 phosphotransferase [Pelagibacteraceae bacterium]MBT6353724.1 phosphotransferase [Pelagibacteraceae bacterium]
MDNNTIQFISSLKFWENSIEIEPVIGGITNQNFIVTDGSIKYFVRIGDDIPEHLVFRSNEIQASKAASEIGICPQLLYNNKSVQIFDYINGQTFDSIDIKKNLEDITNLIKKVHNQIPNYLVGQSVIFWVFHVIKNYKKFLENHESSYKNLLPDLINKAVRLENISSPFEIVFSHNDLLPANFIQDQEKIWLIDWEYAGFNTPLFDLGGLASNNDFTEDEEKYLLENYFEKKLSSELLIKYKAIKCASLLRETMWSMVSEITSNIEFDYKSYTSNNLAKLNSAYENIK